MTSQSLASQDHLTFPWQDSERSIEERVELLLAEMSLEEKVAQLGSSWGGKASPEPGGALTSPGASATHSNESLNVAPMQHAFASAGSPSLEEAEVSFRLDADRTAFTGRDLQRIVEPGEVDILVGRSAGDLPCQARVLLTGPTRVVDHRRCLVTTVNSGARTAGLSA